MTAAHGLFVICLVVAVVVYSKPSVAGTNQTVAFIISVLCGGIRERQEFERIAAAHQSADDITAVCGSDCHDSCDFYHFLVSVRCLGFFAIPFLDYMYIISHNV